jgi:hypothetical protein
MEVSGTCRPQFTTFPDGAPKLLYANFSFDQYLNNAYEYLPDGIMSPVSQERIVTFGLSSPLAIYSYGKRRARVKLTSLFPSNAPDPKKEPFSPIQIQEYYDTDANFGLFNFTLGGGSIVLDQKGNLSVGCANVNLDLRDLSPAFQLNIPGLPADSQSSFYVELY